MQVNLSTLQPSVFHNNFIGESLFCREDNKTETNSFTISRRDTENAIGKSSSRSRLSKALQLLLNNYLNISEIAYTLEFNDPKYFSKCFKREYGLTPREYRDLNYKNMNVVSDLNYDEFFVNRAKEKVQENISNQDFGVDELAVELNVSYSTLYRKIKTTAGISPCNFIRKARIKQAMNMMAHKSLPVVDIAYATGFSTFSYFSRCFKSEAGLLPSQYLEKL